VFSSFTPVHRSGSGPPLLCLHGFMDTWRTWELVLPALERSHEVIAMTMPGHAGGPPLPAGAGASELLDGVEAAMDDEGLDVAQIAGHSLGGWVAMALAGRGRAAGVVAFAPAGGWEHEDRSHRELLQAQRDLHAQMRASAPHAGALLGTPEGRRRATRLITTNFEHIPPELLAHQLLGAAACPSADVLIDGALRDGWPLAAEAIGCPLRIVWGTADRLLPWPRAAARYRSELAGAEWVLLDDVGHSPQLDVPLEAAQLILGLTAAVPARPAPSRA
jgi:pimeloyl-ACP methyl ester carboxylesterase